MDNPHVINLVKRGEDKSALLDEDNLKQLLINSQARGIPVAFYSICGSFSLGKSFLWNQFVRYLKDKHLFLHNLKSEENLEKYFEWEGGDDHCTEGILVYKKPFILKTSKFKEVALFLMDTQGMFDNTESGGTSGMIVALSFLISSLQVYNVSTKIESSHLQYSYKFSKVWKVMEHAKYGSCKPSQFLMLIVRDWRKTRTHPLGLEGGKAYVDKLMEIKDSQASDQRNVRREIHQNFADVSGCLLPEPGEAVINMDPDQSDCQIKDVDEQFYQHIEALFKHLCNPDNIVLKTQNGIAEKGEDLYNHIIEIAREGQEFDGIKETFRAFVENDYQCEMRVLANECLTDYILKVCTEFQEHGKEKDFDRSWLDKRHKELKEEVLLKYDESEKPGNEAFMQTWKDVLAGLIDINFAEFKVCAKSEEIFTRELKNYDNVLRSNAQSVWDAWNRTTGPKAAAADRSENALKICLENINKEVDDSIVKQCSSFMTSKANAMLELHRVRINRILTGIGAGIGSLIVGAAGAALLFAVPAVLSAAVASEISTGLIITSTIVGSGVASAALSGAGNAAFNYVNPVENLIKDAWGQGGNDLECVPAEVRVALSYGVVAFLRVNKL